MKQHLDHILGMGTVREHVDLFPYLSMRLHTTAQYFFEAKTKIDLSRAITAARTLSIPLTFLGGGSNMVFQRSNVSGLVVKNSYSSIERIAETDTTVDLLVGSGTSMAELVLYLCKNGYSGLEFHKGLPGTVGGAVYMNSKWTHPLNYVGDSVIQSTLIDSQGAEKQVNREYFDFKYDYSVLQMTHELVVDVTFRLLKKNEAVVAQNAQKALSYRKKSQPSGKPTCGCFFRNISVEEQKMHNLPTLSAGYLIEGAGLKGYSEGSFEVSTVHANFIQNKGGDSRPEDLLKLVSIIKQKVLNQFGIQLVEEVQIF